MAPCGLAFYMGYSTPQYKSLVDCWNKMYLPLLSINQHNPIMLHGVKNEAEMKAMVNAKHKQEFAKDQVIKHQVFKVEVDETDVVSIITTQLNTEAQPIFIRWL